jgi:4-hydroxy-3-polyprenylbenzoate decarboxylase
LPPLASSARSKRFTAPIGNLEIGALTEMFAFKEPSPMVLFDQIPGYPANFRVVSNIVSNPTRSGLTVGMAADATPIELVARWRELLKSVKPIPPRVVSNGPILENVKTGDDVDMTIFPAPHWHELDGGRYIGTADCVITGEPEEGGWVNIGIYRVQVHDKKTLGLYVSPGHHARIMREKVLGKGSKLSGRRHLSGKIHCCFWLQDSRCRTACRNWITAAGLRGAPVDVIRGEATGLPIPATAEIAIEGEVPPPKEQVHVEGPFGEWPGYYAHGAADEPVIRVKKLYYRNDPIIAGAPPLKPPFITFGVPIGAAAIWNYLEKADVPDIKGVWCYVGGSAAAGGAPFIIVSLKQRYHGHAQQAGIAALGSRAGNYHGRFVIVVDDDIDPSDMKEVIWAVATRCDPKTAISIIDGCWSTPLDPAMHPDQRNAGNFVNSRAILNACRPYAWRDRFPPVNALSPELKNKIGEKWKKELA